MASALFSSRRSSCCPSVAQAANRNKTITFCLTLGLIFVTSPRFSRPAEQKIYPALDVRILVLFKMQLRNMPELQARSQFLPQVARSVFEGGERVVPPALVAAQGHFDGLAACEYGGTVVAEVGVVSGIAFETERMV